jgi:DnaJ like chaperone protein
MGWLGKLVGGTLGFAIGGPIGAIAGATFGHAFDRQQEIDQGPAPQRLMNVEAAQMTFFVGAFSMLAKLSQADGYVSKAETDAVRRFMESDLRLSPQAQRVAVEVFQTALDAPSTFEDFARQFYGQFQHQPQVLELMIDILLRVGAADGELRSAEEALIRAAAVIFQMTPDHYETLRGRYVADMERYYAVLGCRSSATDAEIKTCYRRRVQEYHPDKVVAKGLPEEFVKFANDKFREIQKAYEKIKADRGL